MKREKAKQRDANPKKKSKRQPSSQFTAGHYIRRFEVHERMCEGVVLFCGLLATGMSAFGGHKILLIWTIGIGLCAVILAICFWLTDRLAAQQLTAPKPTPTPAVRLDLPPPPPSGLPSPATIVGGDINNITSQNQSGGFTGINKGTVIQGPQPRVITDDKRKQLIEALRNHSKGTVGIAIEGSASDSKKLSQALVSAFKEADLPARSGFETGTFNLVGGHPPETTGIDVCGAEPLLSEVTKALQAAGLPAKEYPPEYFLEPELLKSFTVGILIRKTPTP